MALDFYDFLTHEKLIIFDGGTGTRLIELGLEPGSGNNLANPELVQQVHKEYLEIGSQVITTNTLTANRIYFQSQSEEKLNQLRKINEVGARLAKDLARNDAFVVGDLGPTGQLLEPYGTFTEEEFYKAYLEQARTLAECEVDGFLIETVYDLREALIAVQACKDAAPIPILVTFSFHTVDKGGRTVMGNSVNDIVKALVANGVTAFGANCGSLAPEEVAEIIKMMRVLTTHPLIAQPNAGKPVEKNGTNVYDLSLEEFHIGMEKCFDNGASILGGCCGTTFRHIEQLKKFRDQKFRC